MVRWADVILEGREFCIWVYLLSFGYRSIIDKYLPELSE
jgi:hypothetical protein